MTFRTFSQWGTQWGSTAILAGIVCGLAALLAHQLVRSPESVDVPSTAFRGPTGAVGDVNPAAAPPKEPKTAYRVIAERTLFHPSRRPDPPPAAPEPKLAAAPPAPAISPSALTPYVLIGIVTDGQRSLALLRGTTGSASVVRLAEGDSLHGWTVAKIETDRVTLRAGAGEYSMAFPKPVASGSVPSAPAPVGAMQVPPARMPNATPTPAPSTPQRR